MFNYIIVGIICVIVLILIWKFINGSDLFTRKRAKKQYEESNGTFDEHARAAFEELTNIDRPNPVDLFMRGNIANYNILETNVRRRAGETQPARDERIMVVGNMVRDFTNAMDGMRNGNLGGDGIGADYMLDHIENFRNRTIIEDEDLLPLWLGFDNVVTAGAPIVRQNVIAERVGAAVANADNREEAVVNYFDEATKYTSDGQNVHDGKVNNDLRIKLRKLKNSQGGDIHPRDAIDECYEYINDIYSKNPEKTGKAPLALQTLDIIRQGNPIGTFADREDVIFAATWARCSHPRNSDNADLMHDAICDALADSIEHGHSVCINGRCGRILNSLVQLDFDRDVSEGALTYEAYKNQIFQETQSIIKQEITHAKESGDASMRAVGESYEGKAVQTDERAETEFKEAVKQRIDENISNYGDKLTDQEISNIKIECYAGIDL